MASAEKKACAGFLALPFPTRRNYLQGYQAGTYNWIKTIFDLPLFPALLFFPPSGFSVVLLLLQKKLVINHSGRLDCAELAWLAQTAKRPKVLQIFVRNYFDSKISLKTLGKNWALSMTWWEIKDNKLRTANAIWLYRKLKLKFKLKPQTFLVKSIPDKNNFSRNDQTFFFCFDFPQNFKRQVFVITSKQLVHETRLFDTQNTTENTHIKFFLPVWKAENFSSLEQEENSEPCHMKEFIENYSRLRLDPMNLYRRIFLRHRFHI